MCEFFNACVLGVFVVAHFFLLRAFVLEEYFFLLRALFCAIFFYILRDIFLLMAFFIHIFSVWAFIAVVFLRLPFFRT